MRARIALLGLVVCGAALGCNSSHGTGSSASTVAPITTSQVNPVPLAPPSASSPPVTSAPPASPPPSAGLPPAPGATLPYTLSWDYDSQVIMCNVGDRVVAKFTTGAKAPKSGTIAVAEYASPPRGHRCLIATDPAGANVVAKSLTYGNTATDFLGPAGGGVTLQPNTTYYFIFDFTLPSGSLSGKVGDPGEAILNLGNVSY